MERKTIDKRKVVSIALSVLVAVVVWIFVDRTGNNGSPRQTELVINDIPIEYRNEDLLADRGLMLLEGDTDTTVDLTLTGSRWDISYVDKSQVKVSVNLLDVTGIGTQRLSPTISLPDGTQGITRREMTPTMITVDVGELYSKTVEIRCEQVGSVAEGFSAGELVLSPAQLEIRGLQEDIDPVSYAKVTMNYDNATSTVVQELEFQFFDAHDRPLTGRGIHPTVDTVTATLPVNVTKELQLVMNFIESPGARRANVDFDIQPRSILVSGDAEKLRNVESITLADFDLSQLDSNTNYSYAIPLPEGCENLSGVHNAVLRIAFRDMKSVPLAVSNFRWENLPEEKTAHVLTEQLTVIFYGKAADVDSLRPEEVTVVADLTDLSSAAGTYTVPVTVRVDGRDIGVSGAYQIRVTISDRPAEPDAEQPGGEEPPPEEEEPTQSQDEQGERP